MVTDSRAGRCSGAEQEHSLLKAKVIISTIEPGHHTIRLIRDGEKSGGGGGGGGYGGGGKGRSYTYRYTIPPPELKNNVKLEVAVPGSRP